MFVSRTAMVLSHNFSYALRLLFAADAGRRQFSVFVFACFAAQSVLSLYSSSCMYYSGFSTTDAVSSVFFFVFFVQIESE